MQRLSGITQHISAGRRQPKIVSDLALRQPQAIGHIGAAVLIIAAKRSGDIQQFARDIGGIYAPGILILNLVKTAFAAAITQRLPLAPVQRFQRRFPKLGRGLGRELVCVSQLPDPFRQFSDNRLRTAFVGFGFGIVNRQQCQRLVPWPHQIRRLAVRHQIGARRGPLDPA